MEFCLAASQVVIKDVDTPLTLMITVECQLHKSHDGAHENKVSPTFIVHW